jgi:hypothetical protein
MKNRKLLAPLLALALTTFGTASALADPDPVTKSSPIRIIFEDWSKREAGEYLKYRDSIFIGIFDVAFRNYKAKCETKLLLEEAYPTQIQVTAQLTCTGRSLDDESFDRLIASLKDELKLEIHRDTPVGPRPGGAGVRN